MLTKFLQILFLLCFLTLIISSCKHKSEQSQYPYTFEEWVVKPGKNRLLIKQDDKYGYTGLDSMIVIPPQYDSALFFNNNPYTLVQKEGLWGIIDESGEHVVDCMYDSIFAYNDIDFVAYPILVKNKQYLIVDTTGKILVQGYDVLKRTFEEDLFIAKGEQGYGLVDPMGKEYTSKDYHQYKTRLGWTTLEKDGQWSLFDSEGKILFNEKAFDSISIEPDPCYNFSNGLRYLVKQDGFWGVVDSEGEWILPNVYETIKYNERKSVFVLTFAQ